MTTDLGAGQLHRLTRMQRYTVTDDANPPAYGLVAHTRDLARAICRTVRGRSWTAEAETPYWPSRAIDQHTRITVTVDGQRKVVVTETRPAGIDTEWWTITIDGQPIPHRTYPGEAPHQIEPIIRSVWRHLNDVKVEPCDRPLCGQPATVATWGTSTCPRHAR